MPEWSKPPATTQDPVLWQVSQALELGRWLGDLPVAVRPSWQLTQLETMPEWSKPPATTQERVLWQVSQALELGT
jgi:hypothetical protein